MQYRSPEAAVPTTPKSRLPSRAAVRKFLLTYHLPIWLVLGVLFGFAVPWPGRAMDDANMSSVCISVIFLLSGLKLKTADITNALRAYKAFILGIVTILGLTPLTGFGLIKVSLSSDEFAFGAAIFVCMPTTLTSGVILTGQAKGNVALALLLTVATNLLGVALAPFWVSVVLSTAGTSANTSVDPVPLLVKLCLTILLPLTVGKLLRSIERVRVFVAAYGLQLKLASSFLLVLVPMMKVATSDQLSNLTAGSFFALAGLALATHAVFIVVNLALSAAFRLPTKERKAVVILGSQKTLPVAVAVIDFLPDDLGEKGLIVIPALIFHFTQIVFDAVVAAQWGKGKKRGAPPVAGDVEVELGGTAATPSSDQEEDDDVKSHISDVENKEVAAGPNMQT